MPVRPGKPGDSGKAHDKPGPASAGPGFFFGLPPLLVLRLVVFLGMNQNPLLPIRTIL